MAATTQQAHSAVTDTAATVAVGGLKAPLRVLHLSDSHISLESDDPPHSQRMHAAFAGAEGEGRAHRDTGALMLPAARFEEQVAAAAKNGTQLIIHTGDFLNVSSSTRPQRARAGSTLARRWLAGADTGDPAACSSRRRRALPS